MLEGVSKDIRRYIRWQNPTTPQLFKPHAQGALWLNYMCDFWKGDHDFILVFNSNNTSIMHRIQYNQVLPLAGNDVIVSSPLGGAVSVFLPRILEGWPWLYIHVALTFFVYILNRFEVIRLYSFDWDFSIWGYFRVVFRGYHSQNCSDIVQAYNRHFLAPIHAFWAINHAWE